MTAICGIFWRRGKAARADDIAQMMASLAPRGESAASRTSGPVAFGTRQRVARPITNHIGDCGTPSPPLIVLDGYLGDRSRLARALDTRSAPGIGDYELVSLAYRKWGRDCFAKLEGDYAIAIWDAAEQTVILARDPAGNRTVYFAMTDELLVFASEPFVVASHPEIAAPVDALQIARYAQDFRALYADPGRTFFRGVRQVPPAHAGWFDAAHSSIQRYWSLDPHQRLSDSPTDVLEQAREILLQVVGERMHGSGKTGVLLSGGLDSSAVFGAAAEVSRTRSMPSPLGLTAVSEVPGVADERAFAKLLESHCGAPVESVAASGHGPFSDLTDLVRAVQSPTIPGSFFLNRALWQQASADGVQMLLDGTLGEFGLSHSGAGIVSEMILRGRLRTAARTIKQFAGATSVSRWQAFKQLVLYPHLLEYWIRLRGGSPATNPRWLADFGVVQRDFQEANAEKNSERMPSFRTPVSRNHRVAIGQSVKHFPGFGQGVADRLCGVAESSPLVDRRLLQFCLAAPVAVKFRDGFNRYMIRGATAGLMPAQIRWRTTKMPFCTDYHYRYHKQRRAMVDELRALDSADPVHSIVNIGRIVDLSQIDMVSPTQPTIGLHVVPAAVTLVRFLQEFGTP